MSKYIDAERLRAETEKRLKNIRDYMSGTGMRYKGPKYFKAQGKESAYDALLNIIDSLQQEQPEVDLEKEWKSYMESRKDDLSGNAVTVNMKDLARHFYELGLKARKEE